MSTAASTQSQPAFHGDTGCKRLASNVLASWGAQAIVILTGFVVPRLVDVHLGQELLGVWDFCWAMASYFVLPLGGIVSAINRHIAVCRARNDLVGLNRVFSSIEVLLVGMAGLILAMSIASLNLVPRLSAHRLGDHAAEAGHVLALLGTTIALQVARAGYAGVITGCHRWDLRHGLETFTNLLTCAGFIGVLVTGGGLTAMACVSLGVAALSAHFTRRLAHRICPGLRLHLGDARWSIIKELSRFGGKAFLPQVADLIGRQGISLSVAVYLGPAALAIFSRPRSLVLQVRTLVNNLALTLTPTAGALQALNRNDELCTLVLRATRYAAYAALPVTAVLMLFGHEILKLWMGPVYAMGAVMAVLALGELPIILQRPVVQVLVGLNSHGRPGLYELLLSLLSLGLCVAVLQWTNWGLLGVAAATSLPRALLQGFLVLRYAGRRLNLDLAALWAGALRGPVGCTALFVAALLPGYLFAEALNRTSRAAIVAAATLLLAGLYWRCAVPESLKQYCRRFVGSRRDLIGARSILNVN